MDDASLKEVENVLINKHGVDFAERAMKTIKWLRFYSGFGAPDHLYMEIIIAMKEVLDELYARLDKLVQQ